MLREFLFAVAVSAAVAGHAETLGFWDFRDGDPGSDVTTIANSAGSGSYVSDTAKKSNGTTGVLPKFNADSPGRIYGGKHGELLSANPQSIDFRYVSRSTRQGGYIDLDGVADAISGNGSFTIEYFFKMNEDYVYWQSGDGNYDNRSKTMLYLESRTGYGAFKQIIPTAVIQDASGHAQGVSLEIYKHDPVAAGCPAFSGDLCDGMWHHIAIVYTQTNDVTKAGQIVLYYDGAKSGTVPYLNDPEGSTGLKFRIGTGYKNQDGADKTGTEPVNASISALRVSSGALAKDDFLQVDTLPDIAGMGTAAYYTFMDGAVGEDVGTVTNAVQAGLMTGTAAITSNGSSSAGELPKFSSDVPGRRVYTDASQQTLLTDNYQSISFRPVQDYFMGGGRVAFEAASTLAHRLDAFTFEYFFKIPEGQTHAYRTPFGYQFGEKEDLKINMQGHSAATGYNNYACEVRTNSTGNAWDTVVTKARTSADLQYGWHHAAFVYTKSDNRVDLYLDKTKFGSIHYTNHIGLASLPFCIGSSANQDKAITEACGGYFACPRLSTSALSSDQFMTASDWPDRYTVFTISFNEGQGKDGQQLVGSLNVDSSVYAKFPDRRVPLRVRYCLHSAVYPQFEEGAAARAGRTVLWGAEPMWENLAGCHFLGYASLASGTSNRGYTGAELCVPGSTYAAQNPESWTMEAFVRPEYDSLDNALLFGKAAVANQHASPAPYPECCWMLMRNKDGKLKLRWTEQATDPNYEYTSASTAYYKSVTTATAVMDRHRWYHVALTYDKPTKTFKLYVNYTLVLTQATSGLELFDSTRDYFFSRIAASYGFEGWMDEIRFSNAALQPESFVTIESPGMFMLFR